MLEFVKETHCLQLCLFVNDLATEIKTLECGVKIGNKSVSILLYADDIVLISGSEESLQKMLESVHNWCQKWQLNINCSKTQIVHFRKKIRVGK